MIDFYIKYRINNNLFSLSKRLHDEVSNEHFKLNYEIKDDLIDVNIECKEALKIEKVSLNYYQDFKQDDRLFFNGYQSWTYSREHGLDAYNRSIHKIPLKEVMLPLLSSDRYSDIHFMPYKDKKGFNRSWTYFYIRNNNEYKLFGSLNEDKGFTSYTYDKDVNYIEIERDLDCVIKDSYSLFKICILKGNEDYVFDKYFELMNIKPVKKEKIIGYSSWYNYYQNINEDIINNDLDSIITHNPDASIYQIDDGFEKHVGDWECDENKFPHGLKPIVDKIHKNNLKAGLWLAPFSAEKNSNLVKEHPDWLVKYNNEAYLCGCNWSSFYALDIYNPEVRKYIEDTFDKVFNEWGFDLVKLDFLYCACILPRSDKPRGTIMAQAMDWLRQLCKGKLILGCGVPLGSAFGKVDYCRIGCDVSLDYDDKLYMHFLHPERPSCRNTMADSIFRRQLNGRAFLNDPDVFILRDENTKLTLEHKKDLALVNSLFGSILFVSDDVSKYNDEVKEFYKEIINLNSNDYKIDVSDDYVVVTYKERKIKIKLR